MSDKMSGQDLRPTPLTDAICRGHYYSACADAAGMGTEIPCEQAYGEVADHAKQMERDRAELIEVLRHISKIGCMNRADDEIWCKGDAHSVYCPKGIADAALSRLSPKD